MATSFISDIIESPSSISDTQNNSEKFKIATSDSTKDIDKFHLPKLDYVDFHKSVLTRPDIPTFIVCNLTWIIDALEVILMSFTLPILKKEFQVSHTIISVGIGLLFVGMTVGSFIWPIFSDKRGRRLGLQVSLGFTSLFGFISAFSPNFWFFLFCRFFVGIGLGGNIPTAFALFFESVPHHQDFWAIVMTSSWGVGAILSSLLAWWTLEVQQSWRLFLILSAIPGFMLMFYVHFRLHESSIYLLFKGRHANVLHTIYHTAVSQDRQTEFMAYIYSKWDFLDDTQCSEPSDRFNANNNFSRTLDSDDFTADSTVCDPVDQIIQSLPDSMPTNALFSAPPIESERIGNVKSLFQNGYGRMTSFLWIVVGLFNGLYYSFSIILPEIFAHAANNVKNTESSLSTDTNTSTIYEKYIFSSLSIIPFVLVTAWIVRQDFSNFSKKKVGLIIIFILSPIFILFGLTPLSTFGLVLSSIISGLINAGNACIQTFVTDVYPSHIRATGLGTASVANRICSAILPGVSRYILNTFGIIPMSIFFAIINLICFFFFSAAKPPYPPLEFE